MSLYIGGWDDTVTQQHNAFLVSEDDFDAIYGRITARGLAHWADAHAQRPGEINHDDGGRGVYFRDPDSHFLEVITRRYGGDTAPPAKTRQQSGSGMFGHRRIESPIDTRPVIPT